MSDSPRIHYEDEDLVIAEKPAGIPTQPLSMKTAEAASDGETLALLIAEKYPELREVGGSDHGAVHRLDRETSGLVIFARNQKTYDIVRMMFSKNQIEKEYVAVVEGFVAKAGKITWPIGPDPRSSKRVKAYRNIAEARKHKALEASTSYEPLESQSLSSGLNRLGSCTCLRIRIKTGRRHQIRVHLAESGYPIVGDEIYGNDKSEGERLHLHASRLKFKHPHTGRWVEIFSPIPFFG